MLAHQRARSEDFQPRIVRNRAKILECLFSDSQLNIKGGISLGGLGSKPYSEIASDVNYLLLSEMKPRPKMEASAAGECISFLIYFEKFSEESQRTKNYFC